MKRKIQSWTLAACMLAVLASPGRAEPVTITLATPSATGAIVPMEEQQYMWKSPLGGWGITVWPFSLRVDTKAILEFTTAEQRLLAKTMGGGGVSKTDAIIDESFKLAGGVKVEDLKQLSTRRVSETINLSEGRHVINPFGMEFTLAADGTLASQDPRLRIDVKSRTISLVCYPVTFKPQAEQRSIATAMALKYGAADLLDGMGSMFEEYDLINKLAAGSSLAAGFRRFTVYLPASAAGAGYTINGTPFELAGDGRVKLAPDAKAACAEGRQVFLQVPVAAPPVVAARTPLGVSWFGGAGEVRMSCGGEAVTVHPGVKLPPGSREDGRVLHTMLPATAAPDLRSGSGLLMVPRTGLLDLQVGPVGARLPAADPRWPQRHVVCDLAGGAGWGVDTVPLEAKPGAEWACRITAVAGKAAIPAALKVQFEDMVGGTTGGEMALKGAGNVFSGTLPSKAGFWRLRVAATEGTPLKGQTLGIVLISDKPVAAVSLFTVHNRALFRRGDPVDLLWIVRRNAGAAAADWPVRLRGMGLDAAVARLTLPAASRTAENGRFALDTSTLSPGEYVAFVEAEGVAGYPFRFRVCQRERFSEFDIYSFNVHLAGARVYPGSPINSYVGSSASGPGLGPYLSDGDGALEAVFGAYGNTPFGPLREMFSRPGMEEREGMAAAVLGVQNAPGWPQIHADEIRNPKHTLPENLATLRRRMALTIQAHVDYPGLDGFDCGWLAGARGYWESTPRLDGWQGEAWEQAQAQAWKRTQAEWPKIAAKYANLKPVNKTLSSKWPKELADIPGLTEAQMRYVNQKHPDQKWWSRILPDAYKEWLADAEEIQPGLTWHDHKSHNSGDGHGWKWMSHRSSVDFSEYYLSPFHHFLGPAILAMDNVDTQKVEIAIQAHHGIMSEFIPLVLGAIGRGADGIAFTGHDEGDADGADALPRLLERFGTWFRSMKPLADVAVFDSPAGGSTLYTVLHDLARIRRPGMMVGPLDVEAGRLAQYKVLLLIGQKMDFPPEILEAFRAFEARGGVILKDDTCAAEVPGKSIGFAYDGSNVAGGWGGAQAGGEGEHVWVWSLFLKKQKALMEAFAATPQPPVTTPDTDVLLSPLAGKETIICPTINKTEIPLEIEFPGKSGRFRQSYVLPKSSELQVEKGWYVHDLMAGKAAPVEATAKGQRVPLEFFRTGGAIYLLTRRQPKTLCLQAERRSPTQARLTGGLADAAGKLLADPMPFEVTLKGAGGATIFRTFAAIGPDHPFDLPVPAMSAGARPELVVRDLVLGATVTQPLEPAAPAAVAVRQAPDLIGGEKKIQAFFSHRKGPVTILLDEGQDAYRPAAEKLAAQLKQAGREARVTTWDTSELRPLPLRWSLWKEDQALLHSVTNNFGWAWRIDMSPWAAFEKKGDRAIFVGYTNAAAGYAEPGPRLRHDADVVLFGLPADHRAVADLAPFLRREPTENYPAAGGFFVHYVWSAFRARYDCLYLACRDVAGAEAAVACLANLKAPVLAPQGKLAEPPLVLRSEKPDPLEDLTPALGSTPIINAEFSPSGNRIFVVTASYGDWFYVLDADGKILEKRMPPVSRPFPNWFMWGRWVSAVSETAVRIHMWDYVFQYDLTRGLVSKMSKQSRLEDKQAGLTFQSDVDRMMALDAKGRQVWKYADVAFSPDLSVARQIVPRALSGDRKVLLVSAFGKGQAKTLVAPALMGLESATGKVLWQRPGLSLNEGKVMTLDDRFIVITDDKAVHELVAATGRSGSAMAALTGNPDMVVQLPGREALLIVENEHFSRQGVMSRVYIRSLKGGADQDIKLPGRVRFAVLAPDNQSLVVATTCDQVMRLNLDGTRIWEATVPTVSQVRFSPDGKTVLLTCHNGCVQLLHFADGKIRGGADLNFGNNITAERFVKQEAAVNVPDEAGSIPQPPPPEPSYLKSIPPKLMRFAPNQAAPELMKTLLKPAAAGVAEGTGYLGLLREPVKLPPFKANAGTYLVELLIGSQSATNDSSLQRVEVSVTGKVAAKNLPCQVRLPVDRNLARCRFAFRVDQADEVTVVLRAIEAESVPRGTSVQRSFDRVQVSMQPVVIGDLVVAQMKFGGRNVLFDGGPGSKSRPSGSLDCQLSFPAKDNTSPAYSKKLPAQGFRLVNGMIANQPTEWNQRDERDLNAAAATTSFKTPVSLSVIVVYEDLTGPVSGQGGVQERATIRYAVDVRGAAGQGERVGAVSGNRNLVNIFPCPAYPISGIGYAWGGLVGSDTIPTDGFVRMAQFEAYATDTDIDADNLLNVKDEGVLKGESPKEKEAAGGMPTLDI
jgi:hypothetical protein